MAHRRGGLVGKPLEKLVSDGGVDVQDPAEDDRDCLWGDAEALHRKRPDRRAWVGRAGGEGGLGGR